MLQQLTKSNAAIQKIVAFESAFERLLDIITEEGSSDGGKRSIFPYLEYRIVILRCQCNPSPFFPIKRFLLYFVLVLILLPLCRYCGGGLFAAAAQPAQEQQLQSELLQGGLLHSENEALV